MSLAPYEASDLLVLSANYYLSGNLFCGRHATRLATFECEPGHPTNQVPIITVSAGWTPLPELKKSCKFTLFVELRKPLCGIRAGSGPKTQFFGGPVTHQRAQFFAELRSHHLQFIGPDGALAFDCHGPFALF